jgi:hypothetical protein
MAKSLFLMTSVLLFLVLFTGCVSDEERQREIREKAEAGQYEEAERLAFEYFAADKLLLLISLEYIADKKDKALKRAYKHIFLIDDWDWAKDRDGRVKVDGRVVNQGDRTVTGFAIRIEYVKNGEVIDRVAFTESEEIKPGMYKEFERTKYGLSDCDQVFIDVVDFAIKN